MVTQLSTVHSLAGRKRSFVNFQLCDPSVPDSSDTAKPVQDRRVLCRALSTNVGFWLSRQVSCRGAPRLQRVLIGAAAATLQCRWLKDRLLVWNPCVKTNIMPRNASSAKSAERRSHSRSPACEHQSVMYTRSATQAVLGLSSI